jgi:hypothetical protein
VAEPGWLTLAEAGGWVTIGEVSDAGSVPTLVVKNNADRPVLLLDGEELLGAKQNRILNTTVLLSPSRHHARAWRTHFRSAFAVLSASITATRRRLRPRLTWL